ncbi:ADP-ribosylglycohydrolase family protein [Kibdelosporangium philippinense]|uniref:ADP-ribosylglycohydrolase family protein n=1 Tax=Kibdelosporangium philippinense TaxID=211113 RepID=A0ABS8Z9V1_9PSEU|nr:ADP-ribosylglycohydrolase family protein [Kibdelosporangium philippinense]MCE7003823.1 ADP-ribosylglycohydrolase family protein [Kibdelosporangium philippinense]
MNRVDRAIGAIVGTAVGDALGAPFEFLAAGTFSATGTDEMNGGGSWEPGEATDDTQMAVHVGESLLERGGLDLPDIFDRFQRWCAADPMDVGIQTEDVLTNGHPWDKAAQVHFEFTMRAAGNGCLMRAVTSAVYFAHRESTMDAARKIAALTHGDPAAWEGTAIFHDLIRVALDGGDPLDAIPDALAATEPAYREKYATVLSPDWHPRMATESNGAIWPCLGSAVWVLRHTSTFEDAIRTAVDLGHDTDTVGAVTGGLAGAVYGIGAIPDRWTTKLHVPLPGAGDRVLRLPELVDLAERLNS